MCRDAENHTVTAGLIHSGSALFYQSSGLCFLSVERFVEMRVAQNQSQQRLTA